MLAKVREASDDDDVDGNNGIIMEIILVHCIVVFSGNTLNSYRQRLTHVETA